MHYDVIVAGAGPAGASAATRLVRQNCSVLLLEKGRHPRHKSCGGGLSARLLPYLDPDVQRVIENEITTVSIRYREKKVSFSSKHPFAYLVRRPVFDADLSRRAEEVGVEVREASPLTSWRETKDGVHVEHPGGKDSTAYLIAADGANSRIARTLYPGWKRSQAPSLEEGMAHDPCMKSSAILLDLSVKKGYGWIFPKTCEADAGIGIFKGGRISPRNEYARFLSRHDAPETASRPHGAVLPLYQKSNPSLVKGRVLLTGDAAALVDPFFGEGIYYAVRSGQMAAEAICEALRHGKPITNYQEKVAPAFYPEFEAAHQMARFIYTFPGFFLETVRRYPRLMAQYIRVFQGELGYRDFWVGCKTRAVRKLNPFTQFFAASSQS